MDLDVWFGLQANAKEITAIEVNAASVAMVDEYHVYNGNLYGNSAVRVMVDEGRSVLERENTLYDLIFLSQVVTIAAERDGYSLVENTAYTIEAFESYLDHLRPEGQLALKLYDEPTLTRSLATTIAAFKRRGLTDAESLEHIIVLLDANVDPPIPLLMVRNSSYTAEDALSIGAVARDVGFRPLFLPGIWAEAPLDVVANGSATLDEIIADVDDDFSPTTDNRPFFFQFERGVPATLRPLLLVMAIVLVGAGLLVVVSQRGAGAGKRYAFSGYFALLGAAFMIAEVTLMQQTRLFLGHPTYSITVVLAILLVGGGIGSGLAGRLHRNSSVSVQVPWWPFIGAVAALLIWLFVWPLISHGFHSAEVLYRIAVVGIALFPVALFIGMPFPLGLRSAGELGDSQVALGWAINGVTSVAGSVVAITLAMLVGYNAVLVSAVAAYGCAALLVILINRSS